MKLPQMCQLPEVTTVHVAQIELVTESETEDIMKNVSTTFHIHLISCTHKLSALGGYWQ